MARRNGWPQIDPPADEWEKGARQHAVERLKESLAHHDSVHAPQSALKEAWDIFFVVYFRLIADVVERHWIVQRHRLDARDPDDCVQQICTRIIEKQTPRLHNSEYGPFDRWLSLDIHRDLCDLAIPARAREKRRHTFPGNIAELADRRVMGPELAVDLKGARDRLATAVRRTLADAPASHARVVRLHYQRGFRVEEICEQLGLTPAAVRSCCRRVASDFLAMASQDPELERLLRRLSWSPRRILRNSIWIEDNSVGEDRFYS